MKILDGAFGTMAQADGLPDLLCLTNPGLVADIHRRYAEAGADIITTNSLNANAFSLAEYGLADCAYDIARRAAELAKEAGRLVAGAMGPTGVMLSKLTSDKPADALHQAYRTQAQGLIDGGAGILLIETVTDVLNARVACAAIRSISADFPIMISATLDPSGLLYSGQTVEEFCEMMAEWRPMSMGLNCGFGVSHLLPYLSRLSAVAPCQLSFHPNAGLPGHYDTPAAFAAKMLPAAKIATILGGCCGTTPAHISALKTSLNQTDNL